MQKGKIYQAEKIIIAQGNLKKIQEIARNSDVPIEHDKPIIEEGWVGKPKGMMQLLYKRGFLDSTKLDSYTLNGKKDKYGHTIPNTSLKEMMNSLVDFWKRKPCYSTMADYSA